MTYYKKHEPFFGSWHIAKLLGEGSFGKVFEIQREDFGETYKAALKVITVPQNESEVRSVMQSGMDQASVTEYFEGVVKEIVSEFVLMSKLKGNSHVVSYEDHQVIPHEGSLGWDILIRMELLTPLMDYAQKEEFTRKDVIKLGIDMCHALELCQKRNIIHRDIKPENIFVSESGNFKLGDFGIARTIEKTSSGLSKKGTYTYMAPEVYKGEEYGSSVDIYSLGIVMYRLLNNNRTPFLPPYPEKIKHSDIDNALVRRISGEQIPTPTGADGRLAEIVLKACAYNPAGRYSSPRQMRTELEAIVYGSDEASAIYPQGDEVTIGTNEYETTSTESPTQDSLDDEGTVSVFGEVEAPVQTVVDKTEHMIESKEEPAASAEKPPTKKKKFLLIAMIPIAVVVLLIAAFNLGGNQGNAPIAPTPQHTAAPAATTPALVGEWRLVEHNGENTRGSGIYLTFFADGTGDFIDDSMPWVTPEGRGGYIFEWSSDNGVFTLELSNGNWGRATYQVSAYQLSYVDQYGAESVYERVLSGGRDRVSWAAEFAAEVAEFNELMGRHISPTITPALVGEWRRDDVDDFETIGLVLSGDGTGYSVRFGEWNPIEWSTENGRLTITAISSDWSDQGAYEISSNRLVWTGPNGQFGNWENIYYRVS